MALLRLTGCDRGSLFSFRRRGRTQPEEPGPVPIGAGDFARDGRKAGVGLLAPDETARDHGHRVALVSIFPDEDGAGLEMSLKFGTGFPTAR